MTPQQQSKHELRPMIRRLWAMLAIVVAIELAFAAITRSIHVQGKEARRADSPL